MLRRLAFALILLMAAASLAARTRAVRSTPVDFSRTLWIAAHPDDESLIAPFFGALCVDGRAACSLLILTHGENGPCALDSGCTDLGAIRANEAASAAAMLHSHLTLWNLADVMADVDEVWSAAAGNRSALLDRIRSAIAAERPTAIITFDPRHGSSCHPAHRDVGQLVVDAVAGGPKIPVLFVETRIRLNGQAYVLSAATDSPQAIRFDPGAAWAYTAADMRLHASQFPAASIDSLAATPESARRIILLPSELAGPVQYVDLCE